MTKIMKTVAGSEGVAACILVLVGVLFLGSNAVAQTGDSMNTKLTIVFVHGLWADGSSWNKVINPLVDKGYKVISVQNPTTSLEDDVAATKRVIDRADGECDRSRRRGKHRRDSRFQPGPGRGLPRRRSGD